MRVKIFFSSYGKEDMKRKITYVILLLLMVCAYLLTGCIPAVEKKEEPMMEPLPKEDAVGEGENAPDWNVLQENLRPSILQITCGGYTGSGVVWEITDEEVTVISSGHLLQNAEVCEVECYAGIYYEAKVENVLEDCDIGFAVFPTKALQEDEAELKAAERWERGRNLIRGEELAIYGSMGDAAGNFVKGYLIEAEREIQLDGYETPQMLMLGGIVGENVSEEGLVDAGMSGSGVFDRWGRLLGILAGGDGKQGFAAVPVWKFMQ